jgi:NAD(P)H-hydrate epimerase
VIEALKATSLPVTSVDAPSSWDIEEGPPKSGPGKDFHPTALVSLTAPKPLVKWFQGRHFLGGRWVAELYLLNHTGLILTQPQLRFLSPEIARKYNLDLPEYNGIDQIVELGPSGQKL